jgi:hypothetical protein
MGVLQRDFGVALIGGLFQKSSAHFHGNEVDGRAISPACRTWSLDQPADQFRTIAGSQNQTFSYSLERPGIF